MHAMGIDRHAVVFAQTSEQIDASAGARGAERRLPGFGAAGRFDDQICRRRLGIERIGIDNYSLLQAKSADQAE